MMDQNPHAPFLRKLFALSVPDSPVAWCCGLIASFWAAIPLLIQTWLLLAVLDWAMGAINAAINGRFCAREGAEGGWRKLVTLILILVARRILEPMHLPIDLGNTIIGAFVVNEGISIVENAADAGAPIPTPLVEALARARKVTGRGKTAAEVRQEIEGQ